MDAHTVNPELIWGASAIARAIGRTDRQTFHLLNQGILPAKRVGNRWVAERGALMRFFTMETTTRATPGSTTPAAARN